MATSQNITTGLKADFHRLISLLGQSMYAGNVVEIAFKELLQNSYDAVKTSLAKKQIEAGHIDMRVETSTNSIIIKDNGCGMSPSTVNNCYLAIGGTLKDLDMSDRSGGLGVAKVQFFATTSRMKVVTVKDGKKTSFDTDIEALFSGETVLKVEDTDAANGTEVQFFYPKEKVSVDSFYGIPSTLEYPLVGHNDDIFVTFKKYSDPQRICVVDTAKYSEKMNFSFDWADIDILLDPMHLYSYGGSQQVFSAGLYQFQHTFHKSPFGNLGLDILVNIKPKVTAENNIYPFNLQRQGFKPNDQIKKDLEVIGDYLFDIQFLIRQEQILREYAAMETLEYVKLDATSAPTQHLDKRVPETFSTEFISKVRAVISQVKNVYEESETIKETRLSATKAEEERAKSISLKYQNKTTGDVLILVLAGDGLGDFKIRFGCV